MKRKVIACEVMKEEILAIGSPADVEFDFVSMNYHLHPKKLAKELQNIIDRSIGFNRIILAFGLYGGAAKGLKANNCILTIPNVHDCISIFLYSGQGYVRDFEKERGTFYLTRSWMVTENSILLEHEKIVERYGEEKALRILKRMFDDYKKVLFIKTGSSLEADAIGKSREIAKLINVKHEIIEGKKAFIEKIINGPWDDMNFVNVVPGETLKEEYFLNV